MAYLGAASVSTFNDAKELNLMPSIDIATPVSSAPINRLALGVGWVRPGAAVIGGTVTPSNSVAYSSYRASGCFEGNDE